MAAGKHKPSLACHCCCFLFSPQPPAHQMVWAVCAVKTKWVCHRFPSLQQERWLLGLALSANIQQVQGHLLAPGQPIALTISRNAAVFLGFVQLSHHLEANTDNFLLFIVLMDMSSYSVIIKRYQVQSTSTV